MAENADHIAQQTAQQALLDVQRYLADEIAPLMAVDAAEVLLRMPPKYGAAAIRNWLEAQLSGPHRSTGIAGYLYHAVKKFHLFSEFDLIDPRLMARYLSELSRIVVQLCPEQQQTELRLQLSRLGEVETKLSAPVRLLNRELGTEQQEQRLEQLQRREAGRPDNGPEQVTVSPRMALMIDRVEELDVADRQAPSDGEKRELLARLVAKAAVESHNPAQLDASLERLRGLGLDSRIDRIFRLLGERLPGWSTGPGPDGSDAKSEPGRLLQAMHRLVALSGNSKQGVERFSEMVYTAIEQFNEGHLAQAVAMFELAQRLIEEQKVDAELAGVVRARAQSSVSLGPLRRFAAMPTKHGLLRKVLRFFPTFSADSLLVRLDGEPKRELRKLMLSLIEVHGAPCRHQLLERLASYASGDLPDPEGFYSRNVIFLLRRIPLAAEEDRQRELRLLSEFSRPGRPFMVTKEAVGALAHLGMPQAESILLDRLSGFEALALQGDGVYDREELLEMMDRTCAALTRLGTHLAVRGVLEHGYRRESELGDTTSRLRHLGACDLVRYPEELDRLVESLRKRLPGKLLGAVLKRRSPELSHLIRTLSGTHDPRLLGLFEEIAERFPDQEFGEQAREALVKLRTEPAAADAPVERMSGDLELFGLPTLLQSMADSELSGRLVISELNGYDHSVLLFSKGKILDCRTGRLRGMDAACQLFERPQAGKFRFEKATQDPPNPTEGTPLEVMETVLEGVRRHDEFQEDRALVPDGISLAPTGATPSLPDEESDRELVREVWREASRGTAPESCEGAVAGDAYRVRRLYAHWFECGALKLRPA